MHRHMKKCLQPNATLFEDVEVVAGSSSLWTALPELQPKREEGKFKYLYSDHMFLSGRSFGSQFWKLCEGEGGPGWSLTKDGGRVKLTPGNARNSRSGIAESQRTCLTTHARTRACVQIDVLHG